MTNFGESKTDLSSKYRHGLESALANASFLESPDLTLLQAVAIFLLLLRRHDSPRYVWMMTGLVIRMAHYLGLQRDGTYFDSLTPFEVEMRRRLWWVVVMLDVRASEDQGTEITIPKSGFDTRLPLNIDDVDIDPDSTHMPLDRAGKTDTSFIRACATFADISIQMAANIGSSPASLENQDKFLNDLYQRYNEEVVPHVTEPDQIVHWTSVTAGRVTIGKLTLIAYLPSLFSSPSDELAEEIRIKLLISAIEVAENNHALNVNQACRRWRWVWQVYTHWYAIVFLLIETSRRPWSPVVERAWVALHSEWLFPQQSSVSKNARIWIPLRKLMHKARRHREAELHRLRTDPQAVAWLELDDQKFPTPSEPYPSEESVDKFLKRWRDLVMPAKATQVLPNEYAGNSSSTVQINQAYLGPVSEQIEPNFDNDNSDKAVSAIATNLPGGLGHGQSFEMPYNQMNAIPVDGSNSTWPEFASWLWADTGPSIDTFPSLNMDFELIDHSVDLDGDMNWYDWVESAKAME